MIIRFIVIVSKILKVIYTLIHKDIVIVCTVNVTY